MVTLTLAVLLCATHEFKLVFPPGGPHDEARLVVTTSTFARPFIGPIGGPDAEATVRLEVGNQRIVLLHEPYLRDFEPFKALDEGRLSIVTRAAGFSWCFGACEERAFVWFGARGLSRCNARGAEPLPTMRELALGALTGLVACGEEAGLRWAAANPDPELEVAMARWLTHGLLEHRELIAAALRPRLASNPAAAAVIVDEYEARLRTPGAKDRDFFEALAGRPERLWVLPYWPDGGLARGRAQLVTAGGGVRAEQSFDGGAIGFEPGAAQQGTLLVRAIGAEPLVLGVSGLERWNDQPLRASSLRLEVQVTRHSLPVRGALVTVFDDRLPVTERLVARGVSDETGRVHLEGLAHGGLRVETRVPGEPCDERFVSSRAVDVALVALELTTRPGIELYVLDRTGREAVPGLTVRVRRVGATDGCSDRVVVTDELGRLVAPGLPSEGRYRLEGLPKGRAAVDLGEVTPGVTGQVHFAR